MAKNRSSKFGVDDELFNNNIESTQVVQEEQEEQIVQEEQGVQETQGVQKLIKYSDMKTQGKKGKKLKRINMGFSDMSYEYIIRESRKRGLSATAFLNLIIEAYIENENTNI